MAIYATFLDIWSRNKLCKRGCQSKIVCRTNGLSANGLSNQWAVEPMDCRNIGTYPIGHIHIFSTSDFFVWSIFLSLNYPNYRGPIYT